MRLPLLALACCIPLLAPAPAAATKKPDSVRVMTRNIYLGADIQRPLVAVAGCQSQQACVTAFGIANGQVRAIVEATDFPARARLLAKEIDDERPDLIGLQEVALWRRGTLQLNAIGVPNAETVDYDFLQILLDALAARGLDYDKVHVQQEIDIEGPAFTAGGNYDARLTMRDVILRRAGSDVKVKDSGGGNYATNASANVAGLPIVFTRGYAWADVKVKGKPFRFVNTHLEAFSSFVALAQAQELAGGAASPTNRTVVMTGDYNSDPLNGTTKPGDPTPHWAPYRFLTGAAGFTDGWPELGVADPGWTSGLSETVDDEDTTDIDHRIDLVLARAGKNEDVAFAHGAIVGTDPLNRSPAGLWPSDHAGVVMDVRP
jgi:endonuclease/exonuclease/phosphatase family metal-dependent hydrolase